MTFLITGQSGFIGTHLTTYLKSRGHQVTGLNRDLLYTPDALEASLLSRNPDVLVHCASYGNLASQIELRDVITANVTALSNLITASLTIPYKAFINLSSSALQLPDKTAYTETKRIGEKLVSLTAAWSEKPILSVRLPSVTGVGEQPEHLIPRLLDSCLNGTRMPFVAHPTHDYVAIQDICKGIESLALVASDFAGQVINLGSGVPTSNAEVKGMIESLTGKKATLDHHVTFGGYATSNWKVTPNLPGWKPEKSLRETLAEMVKSYEQNHE